MFYVGQKVVCVEDFSFVARFSLSHPNKNCIYTIRDFENRGDYPALRLCEVINPVRKCIGGIVCEPAFACESFRPVVERKTDINIFTEILDNVNAGKVREIVGV